MEVLIRKGYVITKKSEPVPEQGGRSKTIYIITDDGKTAVRETLVLHENIRDSLLDLEFGI